MKHLTTALIVIMSMTLFVGCAELLAKRLPDGSASTQPTTQPLSNSRADSIAQAAQLAATITPPPWNAIIAAVGSALGVASAIYAKQHSASATSASCQASDILQHVKQIAASAANKSPSGG